MLLVLVVVVLLVVGLVYGDGLPGNMVLSLDLRQPIDDSSAARRPASSRPGAPR